MTLKMMMTTQKQTLRRKLMHLETMEPKTFQSRNNKQTNKWWPLLKNKRWEESWCTLKQWSQRHFKVAIRNKQNWQTNKWWPLLKNKRWEENWCTLKQWSQGSFKVAIQNKQKNDDEFEDNDDYSKTNVEKKVDAPWTHWGQGHFKVANIIFKMFFFFKRNRQKNHKKL